MPAMPPKRPADASEDASKTKKRKGTPSSSMDGAKQHNQRARQLKVRKAREIVTQSSDSALQNGELDLQPFLKAREFEINALESAMRDGKGALNFRAFQQVPRDMRRRTASHNVKRVPKRLQNRAKREQIQDNTPTVLPGKKKPANARGRIRAETAKRLGVLAAKKRATKSKSSDGITARIPRPKVRKDKLNDPQKLKSKFRKRQIHKTWLPTHLWHAKRANMTEPKKPLWRFAIPIKSTEKSYRPTHRAGGARGAVAWDTSYMSTIGLEGSGEGLEKVLKALGVKDEKLWEQSKNKWRSGKRSWSGWLSMETKEQRNQIGPSTIVWCPEQDVISNTTVDTPKKKVTQQLFIRIHPSIFLETWTELVRLSKLQRPAVHVTDLRFEVGSIQITGPGSTEALLGILHPYNEFEDSQDGNSYTFKSLAGVTNAGSLPLNALLSFSIKDPRLQYPPRTISLPSSTDEKANFALLERLSTWPVDMTSPSSALFDRNTRLQATRLPSQKALNRRKGHASPGSWIPLSKTDPKIPVMLLATRAPSGTSAQGSWTLLAPWKCILPIWYGLVHYPLSSGGNPRFGGLQELRQTHFEQGVPSFPADFPGTKAGFAWESVERERRRAEWERRPKGKRLEWESLDLGANRTGEVGLGWACNFEKLVTERNNKHDAEPLPTEKPLANSDTEIGKKLIELLLVKDFNSLLSSKDADLPPPTFVATVRLTLVSRGVASPCARIYRLPAPEPSAEPGEPSSNSLPTREQWLSLLPTTSRNSKSLSNLKSKIAKQQGRIPLNVPLPQRARLLAQSLLQAPSNDPEYPLVPGEEDLIGFVTTGEFNLAEGKGTAFGSLMVGKSIEGLRRDKKMGSHVGRLCIVRNAGENTGRLAKWEPV
jgi:ribonuclease P/MRP protein subunit POP1